MGVADGNKGPLDLRNPSHQRCAHIIAKNVVSAKKSLSEVESEIEAPAVVKQEPSKDYSMYFEMIISQMQEAREEEKKRFTIYLVVAGLLLAIFLMYIDKLQSRVRELSSNVRRIHWIHAKTAVAPQSSFQEPYAWFD